MTLKTNENDPNNRGRQQEEIELRSIWLRSAELAQTPREDLINELLERYSSVSGILRLFSGFDFTPKKPRRVLVL